LFTPVTPEAPSTLPSELTLAQMGDGGSTTAPVAAPVAAPATTRIAAAKPAATAVCRINVIMMAFLSPVFRRLN
jgi:hypothetical protein